MAIDKIDGACRDGRTKITRCAYEQVGEAIAIEVAGAGNTCPCFIVGCFTEQGKAVCSIERCWIEGRWHPGFRAKEYELPFSYDIHNNFTTSNEATGQFKMLGWVGSTPVIMMRVDREDYIDTESNKPKYRNQPQTADVIAIVDAVQRQEDETEHPIAFVTSATYEPSRTVDAARASLKIRRPVGVATYGTARLASVKGEDVPQPAALNQLPGELHKLATNTRKLEAALAEEV